MANDNVLPVLIPLRQAAKILDIHPVTLQRWSHAGKLPFYKLGNRVKFAQADLERFLQDRRI